MDIRKLGFLAEKERKLLMIASNCDCQHQELGFRGTISVQVVSSVDFQKKLDSKLVTCIFISCFALHKLAVA